MIATLLLTLATQLVTPARAQPMGVIDFDLFEDRIFMIMEDGSFRYLHSSNTQNQKNTPFASHVSTWLAKNRFRLVGAARLQNLFLVTQSHAAYVVFENRIFSVPLPKNFIIKTIESHFKAGYCALSTDQRIRCWTLEGERLRVPPLIASSRVTSLGAVDKRDFFTATTQSGLVFRWQPEGRNRYFLGGNSHFQALRTLPFGTDFRPVQSLSFGARFSSFYSLDACALSSKHEIRCMGYDVTLKGGYERKPVGIFRNIPPHRRGSSLRPVLLGKDFLPVQIVGTTRSACARSEKGEIKCWGENNNGNLGEGNMTPRGQTVEEMGEAVPLVDLGKYLYAVQLKAQDGVFCALLNNSSLKCWGTNVGTFHSSQFGNIGDDPGEMGDSLHFIDPDFVAPEPPSEEDNLSDTSPE